MYRVEELNGWDDLQDLRPDWDRLLKETPGADFFHTLDWLEVYWRHYGARQRLRVITITEDGETIGIVPLVVGDHGTPIGNFRVLKFPLDYWGSCYGPIGAQSVPILSKSLQYIAGAPRDWQFVELNWLQQSRHLGDLAEGAMRRLGMPPSREIHTRISIAELGGSWDDYFAGRSSNWRSNCRRNDKKLAKAGRVEYLRYRPRGEAFGESDPRWDLYDHCERIAHMSWQGSSTDGTTITHESVRPFLRDVHEAAAKAGCLDMNLLLVDDLPVAFNYNYVYQGYASSLRLGFDPAYRKYGVGTVLTCRMLRDSFSRGDHTFDFLPGSHEMKRPWRTTVAQGERIRYLPRSFSRLEFLRTKHWIIDRIQGHRRAKDPSHDLAI